MEVKFKDPSTPPFAAEILGGGRGVAVIRPLTQSPAAVNIHLPWSIGAFTAAA